MAGVVNTEYRGLLFGKPSQPTNSTGGMEMTDDFWKGMVIGQAIGMLIVVVTQYFKRN